MKITLNTRIVELDSSVRPTLHELLATSGMPQSGIAVALNNRVIKRADWESTMLADGDSVTVITAICGG